MKKIIFLIILMLCLVGCGKKGYTEIRIDEFYNKMENKETFVIVLGSDTCSACESYRETMAKVIGEKKVEIFYLDFDKLEKEEYAKLYSKFVVTSTPTTVFIKNGIEESTYNRIVGAADYSTIIKNLQKHGIIGD